jgi:hypothetical protein
VKPLRPYSTLRHILNKWNPQSSDGSSPNASLAIDVDTLETLEAAADRACDVAVSVVMVSDGEAAA